MDELLRWQQFSAPIQPAQIKVDACAAWARAKLCGEAISDITRILIPARFFALERSFSEKTSEG